MEHNDSEKQQLILKEYGKNIQQLVQHVVAIEDRERRTQSAHTIVEIIKQLNPTVKQESDQKLWDDLYMMSGFTLDIDGPFPMPEKELLGKKPPHIGYPKGQIKFKHYGRNIEKLIEKAIDIENDQDQENAIIYIGQLMRSFHSTWNRDNFDDNIILDDIKTLSKGKLHIDLEKVQENALFESNTRRDFKIPHQEEEHAKKKNIHGKKFRPAHKKRR